jgi:transcriptional regulator
MPQETRKLDLLQGTLDLLILQTLQTMGPQHGYGLVRRIEQVSGRTLLINQGTVYASLVRLQDRGWIAAAWGESDNHRRAKFYSLTRRGRRQLQRETSYWRSLTAVVERVLNATVPEAE